jgi:hypothetical protein
MLIGRHYESTNLSSSAKAAAEADLGVFSTTSGNGKVIEAKAVRKITRTTISFVRGSTTPNLTCFHREHLLHARAYTVELMRWAESLGFCGVVMEAGAAPDNRVDVRRRLVSSVRSILHEYTGDVQLLIENGTGAGSLTNIAHCLEQVDDPRLGVSLHLGDAYARGYEVYDLLSLSFPRVGVVQLTLPNTDVQCGGGSFRYGVIGESAWTMREVGDLALAHQYAPIVVTCKTPEDADIIRKFADGHDNSVWVEGDLAMEERLSDGMS